MRLDLDGLDGVFRAAPSAGAARERAPEIAAEAEPAVVGAVVSRRPRADLGSEPMLRSVAAPARARRGRAPAWAAAAALALAVGAGALWWSRGPAEVDRPAQQAEVTAAAPAQPATGEVRTAEPAVVPANDEPRAGSGDSPAMATRVEAPAPAVAVVSEGDEPVASEGNEAVVSEGDEPVVAPPGPLEEAAPSVAIVAFAFEGAEAAADDVARALAVAAGCDGVTEVRGHTCAIGAEEANRHLGLLRARAVRDQLVARGVAPERLRVRSAGASAPVASNATEAGRQRNRRAEVRCLQGP